MLFRSGAMAPENTAIRKPGKRMRTFSRERVAREIGGSSIRGGTDVLACGRVAQLVREPPKMGPTQMNPEFVRAALEAAMARLTKPDQLDAGYNGYWVFVDNQWSPGHKGVVGARARADLFAIPVGDPPVRIGLFELEVQEDGLHEAWFFTDNQWPNTEFPARLHRDSRRMERGPTMAVRPTSGDPAGVEGVQRGTRVHWRDPAHRRVLVHYARRRSRDGLRQPRGSQRRAGREPLAKLRRTDPAHLAEPRSNLGICPPEPDPLVAVSTDRMKRAGGFRPTGGRAAAQAR